MISEQKKVDVKAYVDWVKTEPNINGFSSYYEAYLDMIGRDNGHQKKLSGDEL
jgi:hypothetical protein